VSGVRNPILSKVKEYFEERFSRDDLKISLGNIEFTTLTLDDNTKLTILFMDVEIKEIVW